MLWVKMSGVSKLKQRKVIVDLNIPADCYVALYSGSVNDVIALSHEGLKIRFPGKILHKFLTRDGVYGTFAISFAADNKFLAIEKIDKIV